MAFDPHASQYALSGAHAKRGLVQYKNLQEVREALLDSLSTDCCSLDDFGRKPPLYRQKLTDLSTALAALQETYGDGLQEDQRRATRQRVSRRVRQLYGTQVIQPLIKDALERRQPRLRALGVMAATLAQEFLELSLEISVQPPEDVTLPHTDQRPSPTQLDGLQALLKTADRFLRIHQELERCQPSRVRIIPGSAAPRPAVPHWTHSD